jgi:aminoglycoside phosphotransferase (APT) family kinase protein
MTYTHDVTIAGDVVRKRYLRTDRKEQEREWEALTLLDRHVPGLAPQPIEQQDGAVVMSRVPGEHLDQPFTPGQTAAVVAAYQQLYSVPLSARLEDRFFSPERFIENAFGWLGETSIGELPEVIRSALEAARKWSVEVPTDLGAIRDPVLAQGDANVENMLWDGGRIRLVDFEGGGRGDLAFEVADLVEHVSSRLRGFLDPDIVISAFDLTGAQLQRVADYRVVLATFWTLMLLPGNPGHDRNPSGSLERQATHLQDLLGR